jgi:hypothetical protein
MYQRQQYMDIHNMLVFVELTQVMDMVGLMMTSFRILCDM